MLTFYYLMFFILTLINFLALFNFPKLDEIRQKHKRDELNHNELTPFHELVAISSVIALVWYLFGLLTPQWGFFVAYLVFTVPVAQVTKRFRITRLLHGIVGFMWQLFMVINYFHLGLRTSDLLNRL